MQSRFINSRAFVRSAMLCSAAVLAIFPVAAMAQAAPAADAADGDAIVVTGSRPIAESEAAALQVQKNSDSLVSVVSSDAAGRLPDQNIAQATGRLPGVAVERDQGQARYISIRGAPNYWTTLSFDGINVVSPEGRDARFDSIPSAIAAQIIVSKAVTPDMPGETVSGNVNVITRSAFDYDGFHFAGKAGYGIAELGNRPQYEGSAVVSTRVPAGEGEIGVLVSGSYYQRAMITDNFETDYERVSQDQRPDSLNRFWAQETENKLYRLTRRNWSLSGRLDWKPNADNSISLRSIYTTFTDDEMRDNFRFDLDDRQGDLVANTAACGTAVNPTPTTTGYADVCIGNTPFQGTIYGIDIRQRSTLRAFEQSIFTNTIEGTHEFGDGWKLNWLGNYTESKDDRSVIGETTWDSPSTRNLRPTVAYDFTDPSLARLRLFTTVQLSSPTRYEAGTPVTDIDSFTKPLASMNILDAVDTTKAYTAKFVVSRETEFLGGDAVLKAGFQFDQRTKTVDESSMALNNATQFATIGISTSYNGFSLDTPFKGKIPMGYTFRYFDADKMRAASDAARTNFTFTPALGNIYDVQEEVMAGYLMGTVRYDWGSAVGGARIERVKNRGTAVATVGTVTGPVTAENSGTLVFPSMHLNFDVDTDKKLRIGFTSGAARADYDQLRPNVVIDDSNQRISGGNPGVKPERSYGVDAYYEYYVQPQGYFMIGAFYKKVEDVLYTSRSTFGSNALDSNGVDRSGYAFSGITNGGSGSVRGVEAAAQFQLDPYVSDLGLPDWMGGFGITANATYNDSEVTKPAILDAAGVTISPERKVPLPGTSEVVYNVGAYYEKYGLSLRLQYQNRTAWADGFADNLDSAGDTYWAEDDELDFSARYEISNGIEIYFDAANLLNNPGRRYSDPSNILNAQGVSTPFTNRYTIEWESFGRRYSGGIRVNF
ncbi:TonB-dependent receptor [Sphingorhabdus rigui]|uniref:TonB-dependent receptor n=1 Tax=Sphingorhabdus rigui TaxID=1282858 RepID=A0A840AXC2_9SPHN|nr:TonB-dependent receptor [Sphingorhabdus rigui]MBB3942271.1 TonB-dependent receptor [Sphingorhabdus rigui]